jgi:uncharacterized membrane protein (DUF373 family)
VSIHHIFDVDELLDTFGEFLLVPIGVELMNTVKIYLVKNGHVEVILAVGLVAITRKFVMIDQKQLDGTTLLALRLLLFRCQ